MAEPEQREIEANPDELIPFKKRMNYFFTIHWRGISAFVIPFICLPIILPPPTAKFQWVAYCLVVMALYWVTECIPLPVTSFLPVFLFPATNVMSTADTCACYMNDTVLLFLGSLMLAMAIEQSGLHKRLAYGVIRLVGYSHYRLLFGMSFVTMFISMWITNTAATVMMVPIIFALLRVLQEQNLLVIFEETEGGDVIASDITTCYFCSVTFSATIGGIGTLVGTATNLVIKGLFEKAYPGAPDYLTFPMFSAFAVPFMLILNLVCYLCMILTYLGFLRPKSKAAQAATIPTSGVEAAKAAIDESWRNLGRVTFWEYMVIVLFGGAMIMFFCRSPKIFVGWADRILSAFQIKETKFIQDSSMAMLVCFLMLLLPSTLKFFKNWTAKKYEDLPKGRITSVLDWPPMNESLPYSFMFLLGGGFALSTASKKDHSDLNGRIGDILQHLHTLPNYVIVLIVIIFTIFFTNFASNVAVANVVAPITMTMAQRIGENPLLYNLAAGLSSSFCFMVPVGTPGNLVVQSAAHIRTKQMIVAGALPTLLTILLTWGALMFWSPVIWPDLRETTPAWISNSTSDSS